MLLRNIVKCFCFHLQKVSIYKFFISYDPVHFYFAFKPLFIAVGKSSQNQSLSGEDRKDECVICAGEPTPRNLAVPLMSHTPLHLPVLLRCCLLSHSPRFYCCFLDIPVSFLGLAHALAHGQVFLGLPSLALGSPVPCASLHHSRFLCPLHLFLCLLPERGNTLMAWLLLVTEMPGLDQCVSHMI